MKYLLLLILVVPSLSKAQRLQADSLIQENSLREALLFLSQDSLKGRLTGAAGADMAAKFIAGKFDSIGLKAFPGDDGYFDFFTADYEGKKMPAKNVVGMLPSKTGNDTTVIFSAHYDHIGQKDDLPYNKEYSRSDDIFNGANDNATGVAALLALAGYYKAQNNNHYRLLFIAFSGEEMGMLGSTHFVEKNKAAAIKTLINLEMLGRPADNRCFIISFRNPVIRNHLNDYLKKYRNNQEKFFEDDPYFDEDLTHRSDHYPFTGKVKNAFTIMGSSPADKYYHSVDDEYGTIDFDFLLTATRNIALACEQFTR